MKNTKREEKPEVSAPKRRRDKKMLGLRIKAGVLCLLMLTGILFTAFPGLSVAEEADEITENDIQKLQDKIDKLQNETEAIQKFLDQLEANESKLQKALEYYAKLTAGYREQIGNAEENILACQNDLENCKAELEKLRKDNAVLYDNLKATLRALREREDSSLLELIFQSESLSELLSSVERAKDLAEYKKKAMAKIDAALKEYRDQQEQLEDQLKNQEDRLELLQRLKAEAEERVEESEKQLTQMSQDLEATRQQLADLEETTEEIQQELIELIKAFEKQEEKKRLARQSLLWPIDYPKNRRITSPYGYRYHPIYGSYKFHTGIDMVGPSSGEIRNNNIYAAMDGEVITAVVNRGTTGYGTYVIISHGYSERYGGNISTLYAHCEKLYVTKGQTVKQGDVIGLVGTTGASTGYHLHFEVRMNGLTTDPLSYSYITKIDGEPVDPYTYIVKDY